MQSKVVGAPVGAWRQGGRGWHVQAQHAGSPAAQTNQQFWWSTTPADPRCHSLPPPLHPNIHVFVIQSIAFIVLRANRCQQAVNVKKTICDVWYYS